MAIYLFSVKTFVFLSSFVPPLIKREGLGFFIIGVQVKVTLRLMVSQSVSLGVEPHLGLMTRYLLLFDSYGIVFSGAPSLTRGRVCLLHMLLVLASAVLGSKSLGTRDHILLSQISDFPFRCLLRLTGSQWRYSTLPPHRVLNLFKSKSKSHCD
jgi:hypothetical protein